MMIWFVTWALLVPGHMLAWLFVTTVIGAIIKTAQDNQTVLVTLPYRTTLFSAMLSALAHVLSIM